MCTSLPEESSGLPNAEGKATCPAWFNQEDLKDLSGDVVARRVSVMESGKRKFRSYTMATRRSQTVQKRSGGYTERLPPRSRPSHQPGTLRRQETSSSAGEVSTRQKKIFLAARKASQSPLQQATTSNCVPRWGRNVRGDITVMDLD